ncbi:MAG: (2Fe-2S)-binding protein [Deltaproteobacteria bacterium]|nr:(2Fe-2S)-binding protein [Deltaproteobacteria bacterium]
MVKLIVDGTELEVEEGTVLLDACLDHGIYIPHLCHLKGMEQPPASCRLCFVSIEGIAHPVPSCTLTVREGMVVQTDTNAVRGLQISALRLLLSVHDVDCAHCPANKKCALQKIAKFLHIGLKAKGLEIYLKEPRVVQDHPLIDYYPNRCVLCGRCIRVCRAQNGLPLMSFAKRGFDTVISFYGAASTLGCKTCFACLKICPVGAITLKTPNS